MCRISLACTLLPLADHWILQPLHAFLLLLFVSFSLLPAGLSFHLQLMKLLHFLLLLYAIISTTRHRGTYAYSIQAYYQYSMIYLHYSTLSATSSSSMTGGTAVRLFHLFLAKLQRIWRDVSIRREREWGGGREQHNGNKRVRGAKCSNFHTILLCLWIWLNHIYATFPGNCTAGCHGDPESCN